MISFVKNYVPFVILEPLNYKCSKSERRMTTDVVLAHKKTTRDEVEPNAVNLYVWNIHSIFLMRT